MLFCLKAAQGRVVADTKAEASTFLNPVSAFRTMKCSSSLYELRWIYVARFCASPRRQSRLEMALVSSK